MTNNINEKNELLPCPFCGDDWIVYGETGLRGYFSLCCANCGIRFASYDSEQLKKRWNTRPQRDIWKDKDKVPEVGKYVVFKIKGKFCNCFKWSEEDYFIKDEALLQPEELSWSYLDDLLALTKERYR